ncbi:PA1571 family protein [Pseudomonas sp. UBA2684]|uniref:PA1571 family protein n=1 Tax=Pseudomonas sp. UBA2684 TaxID=1947311 RepID=UPI0025D8BE17|nr:PA1571 family protein [Pseudomonas sp. UBA2684]|tara:strand:- start:289 stop:459 length:171 start_codon:yes stop_codon:yes gene_type:complete
MNTHNQPRVTPTQPQQPVGGAIIDAQGREIPITENMIQRACNELDKNWVAPANKKG